MEIHGNTALITGSAVRIGKAISLALAEKGCNLILHYHTSIKEVEELKIQIEQMGVTVNVISADLSKPIETQDLIPRCLAFTNKIDILINNAGIYLGGNGMNTSLDNWERQFELNLHAPFILIQSFAKQIPKNECGAIVNITDAKVFRERPDHFAYRLTKSALIDMTKMFALELAPNITINSLALGIMMPLAGFEHIDVQSLAEKRIPLKKLGSPEIAAQNVIYIIEQEFMTGAVIRVDGGESLL